MRVRDGADPRLQAMFAIDPTEAGVRPTVRLPSKGLPTPVLIGGAVMAAVILFAALESRRTQPAEQTPVSAAPAGSFEAAPPLTLPPAPAPVSPLPVEQAVPIPRVMTTPARISAPDRNEPQTVRPAAPVMQLAPVPYPESPPVSQAPRVSSGPAMLVDGTVAPAPASEAALSEDKAKEGDAPSSGGRIRSSSLANRSTTVAQGTLIPAVLETALDSTKAGFVRAIVSRSVKSFDGTQTLVPRGSRLMGDYSSDSALGEKRVMITWTRLIRPDGVTIRLEAPAVDLAGRNGVRASVNTHFFQRFKEALLQSTVDIGRAFAGRSSSNVVVALPGSMQSAASSLSSPAITPTLRIPAGRSLAVFVAHDLEFTAGEGAS